MSQANPNKVVAHVVYALHALSFFFVVTCFVAVIINYVKKSDVKGTWLESHFRWQIRTFWWGMLWGLVGLVGLYFIIGIPILVVAAIWYIYRIIKGWLRLNDEKEMYVKAALVD